jgi:hypothetical protein
VVGGRKSFCVLRPAVCAPRDTSSLHYLLKKTKGMTPVDVDSRPLPDLQHQFPAPHLTVFLAAVREFVGVMDTSAVTENVRSVTHKIRLEKDEPFRIRPYHLVTKSCPVTAPGSQGVFRGRGRGFIK